jgi:acyl-CoA thioesterase-2
VNVTSVRQGRRAESFRVDIAQEGRAILTALVRTASQVPGLTHDVSRAPEVPGPESLSSMEKLTYADAPRMAFWQNLETRPLFPERIHEREVARDPVWREWYRFRPRATFDEPFLDAARSLLLIDTLSWPAACQPHPESSYQAPNLDVSVWFHRAAPASDWLLADHDCPVAEGGLMGTLGRVWSSDGELLASGGAQLLCVPRV